LRNYAIEFVHLDLNGLTWTWNQAYVILQPCRFQFPFFVFVFTAQCTLVQSAVLRSHVVRPSICLSVCSSVCDVGGLWSHRLEILETNCTDY